MNQANKKELDCIAVKREAQNQIYEETKDLTPEQQIGYFRDAVQRSRFRKWWEEASTFLPKRSSKAS